MKIKVNPTPHLVVLPFSKAQAMFLAPPGVPSPLGITALCVCLHAQPSSVTTKTVGHARGNATGECIWGRRVQESECSLEALSPLLEFLQLRRERKSNQRVFLKRQRLG